MSTDHTFYRRTVTRGKDKTNPPKIKEVEAFSLRRAYEMEEFIEKHLADKKLESDGKYYLRKDDLYKIIFAMEKYGSHWYEKIEKKDTFELTEKNAWLSCDIDVYNERVIKYLHTIYDWCRREVKTDTTKMVVFSIE